MSRVDRRNNICSTDLLGPLGAVLVGEREAVWQASEQLVQRRAAPVQQHAPAAAQAAPREAYAASPIAAVAVHRRQRVPITIISLYKFSPLLSHSAKASSQYEKG